MSDKPQDEEKSFVYIEFSDIGSVEIFNYQVENITPLQLLAMAHYVEFEGKSALAQQRAAQFQAAQARQQQSQILVPKPEVNMGKK